MNLIDKEFYLIRKNFLKREPMKLKFKYKSMDIGHEGFLPDFTVIKNMISTLDKDRNLFIEIITGFNNGNKVKNQLIDVVDELYQKEVIDFYLCPGDKNLTHRDLLIDFDWYRELLPRNAYDNKGVICLFFSSKNNLKDKYPHLVNSETIASEEG